MGTKRYGDKKVWGHTSSKMIASAGERNVPNYFGGFLKSL